MKKCIAILMSLTVLTLAFTACSGKGNDELYASGDAYMYASGDATPGNYGTPGNYATP